MNYRLPDNIGYIIQIMDEILKCIILKIRKEKKSNEDVCSSTKSIYKKEGIF